MDPVTKTKNNRNTYLKYSGLGFQFAVLILIAFYLGKWLDQQIGMSKPVFTLLLILVFFVGFLYKLYLDLIKTK